MTDYDITDEVGQAFGASYRRDLAIHLLEFRDKDCADKIADDA